MTQPGVTGWIDVSVTVRHGMPHWPDNPPVVLERVMDLHRGDACNVSHLAMGVHSGTQMDAPVHVIHQGAGLDEMPLAATTGEARVIQIEDPREITAGELRAHRCSRVNGACPDLGLGPVLAGQRFRRGLRVHHRAGRLAPGGGKGPDGGVDYLSAGGYHADGARIHRTLLEAGIGIIEGLDLSPVTARRYEMICLPVKLHGCDGAPARAILRPVGGTGPGRATPAGTAP